MFVAPLLLAALGREPTSVAPAGRGVGGVARDTSPFRRLELPTPNFLREGSGRPGPRYWQQRADYTINVALDTTTHTVAGDETIRYTNNSPDTLTYLWLQVDQNIYRTDSRGGFINPADARWSARGFEGGDMISSFAALRPGTAKGATRTVALQTRVNGTMLRAELHRPLAPGTSITLAIAYQILVTEIVSDSMGSLQFF